VDRVEASQRRWFERRRRLEERLVDRDQRKGGEAAASARRLVGSVPCARAQRLDDELRARDQAVVAVERLAERRLLGLVESELDEGGRVNVRKPTGYSRSSRSSSRIS
jgi:hypothetical protein